MTRLATVSMLLLVVGASAGASDPALMDRVRKADALALACIAKIGRNTKFMEAWTAGCEKVVDYTNESGLMADIDRHPTHEDWVTYHVVAGDVTRKEAPEMLELVYHIEYIARWFKEINEKKPPTK